MYKYNDYKFHSIDINHQLLDLYVVISCVTTIHSVCEQLNKNTGVSL